MPGYSTWGIGVLEFWSLDIKTTNKRIWVSEVYQQTIFKVKTKFSLFSITPALHYSNRIQNYRLCYAAPFQGAKAKPGPEGLDPLFPPAIISFPQVSVRYFSLLINE